MEKKYFFYTLPCCKLTFTAYKINYNNNI